MKNNFYAFVSRAAFALPVALLFAAACASSTPAGGGTADYAGACSELASRCHGIATAIAAECHELGHGGDDARCGPRRSECLAACPEGARDGGTDTSSEVSDASADAAPDPACITYCSCMASSCSSVKNYPFTDVAVCYAACATFSPTERACFTTFCGEAADAATKDHACEHATGKLGTAECP